MALLVQLPFDGTPGSTGGTVPVTANLTGGAFIPGRLDAPLDPKQALTFEATGLAEILPKVVPLNGTYTLTAWLKVRQQPDGPNISWVLYKFSGKDRFLYLDLGSPLTRWSYIVIVQGTDTVSVYLNGRLTASEPIPAGWGKPTGFAVLNDGSASSGYMTIEDLTLYDGVDLSQVRPAIPNPIPPLAVAYSVNGVSFANLGITVSESEGLLDNLAVKDPLAFEWPDYHGDVLDLGAIRFQSRIITLSCFVHAPEGVDQFIERVGGLIAQFQKPRTQRLRLDVHSTKPLVYEVYLRDGMGLKKKWSQVDMIGTFELTLVEPEPVKRVLTFNDPSNTARITLTSRKVVSVHWGDGSHTYDVFGTGVTVSHAYATPGPHFIIVAGVMEDVTGFTTNATVLWNRL